MMTPSLIYTNEIARTQLICSLHLRETANGVQVDISEQ